MGRVRIGPSQLVGWAGFFLLLWFITDMHGVTPPLLAAGYLILASYLKWRHRELTLSRAVPAAIMGVLLVGALLLGILVGAPFPGVLDWLCVTVVLAACFVPRARRNPACLK